MSKSLKHIFLPAFGGTAAMLALALFVANRDYGQGRIKTLEGRVTQVQEQVTAAGDKARVEADRAAELEAKIAEVQALAEARVAGGANLTAPAPQPADTYGLGRTAHEEEIAAWDVDVLPDGRGLPEGRGDVYWGEEVFAEKCAACHGDFAEGVDNWPVLAGGFDTLGDEDPVKTVGSYWPHLSTAWDYINRSMPFGEAGTLTPDETYAIVAYILYSNDMVDDEFELSHENFAEVEMYNAQGFVIDDRPDLEYSQWRTEPCMANCKPEVQVTMRSVFLVETPPEGGSESIMNQASVDGLPSFSADGPAFVPEPVAQPEPEPASEPEPAEEVDEASLLIERGEKVFKKCAACHAVGEGAKNKSGPQLNAVLDRPIGSVDGFAYSKAFQAALEEGRTWDEASLIAFLADPKGTMKGTKMAFSGLKKEGDQEAIIAYLRTFLDP
ncbi:MAG: c-type cytochrome [Pseudomonadota bacterium]